MTPQTTAESTQAIAARRTAFWLPPRSTTFQTDPLKLDVRVNYPWNLHATNPIDAGKAHAALYLINTYSLADLLFGDIRDLFDHMIASLPLAGSAVETRLRNATGGNSVAILKAALEDARNIFETSTQPAPGFEKTYAEYARRPSADWETGTPLRPITAVLGTLNTMISVPLIAAHADAADLLLQQYEHALRMFGATRSVKDLFTKSHHEFSGSHHGTAELQLWRQARDTGLLWCNERISRANHARPPVSPMTPNGRKCNPVTHRCESGGPNDYCQEVDGACTPMGT